MIVKAIKARERNKENPDAFDRFGRPVDDDTRRECKMVEGWCGVLDCLRTSDEAIVKVQLKKKIAKLKTYLRRINFDWSRTHYLTILFSGVVVKQATRMSKFFNLSMSDMSTQVSEHLNKFWKGGINNASQRGDTFGAMRTVMERQRLKLMRYGKHLKETHMRRKRRLRCTRCVEVFRHLIPEGGCIPVRDGKPIDICHQRNNSRCPALLEAHRMGCNL